jgi:hypothetical protein
MMNRGQSYGMLARWGEWALPAIPVFTAPLSERLHHGRRRLRARSHQRTAADHRYIDPALVSAWALFLTMRL